MRRSNVTEVITKVKLARDRLGLSITAVCKPGCVARAKREFGTRKTEVGIGDLVASAEAKRKEANGTKIAHIIRLRTFVLLLFVCNNLRRFVNLLT